MPTVVDYASLTQAILDYTHRATLSAYTDYFIQAAQEEITNDIFEQNFGQGIRFMENTYPPTAISNGVAPVPSDWLAPKDFTLLDFSGNEYDLEFKDPQWIYGRYSTRSPQGIPAYIGRDSGSGSFDTSDYLTISASSNQTVFPLTGLVGNVLFATLDGTMLVPGTDYSVAGGQLTLATGALDGQVLLVQGIATIQGFSTADNVTATATGGQTAFSLSGLVTGSVVFFATLDGVMLVPGTDYTVAGSTLNLTNEAIAGQVLFVQGAPATMAASSTSVFIFGPYPDAAYIIQGVYYQQAPILSSSNTTNWMVLNAPSMLLANCMRQAGKFLKDVEMVQGWTQLYNDALAKLIARDTASRFGEAPLVINTVGVY